MTCLSIQEVRQAIHTYGPLIKFHPREEFKPCSVEAFLAHSRLYDSATGREVVHPAADQLPTGSSNDGRYWLNVEDAFKPGDLSTAKAYVRVLTVSNGEETDLQFWILHAYNGPGTATIELPAGFGVSSNIGLSPLGEHYGDWECCVLRIDNRSKQLIGCTLSQHGTDQPFDEPHELDRFTRAHGRQLVVFSSLNGHALYAEAGANAAPDYDYAVIRGYLRNETAAGGSELNCATRYEIVSSVGLAGETTEPQWVNYPYRWGPEGTNTNIIDVLRKRPATPSAQGQVSKSFNDLLGDIRDGVDRAVREVTSVVERPPTAEELIQRLGDAAFRDNLNGPRAPKMQPTWTARLVANEEQSGWRWCRKCGSMHFPDDAMPSACPAGARHSKEASGDYVLVHGYRPRWDSQPGWRWCHRCAGLHFPNGPSVCQQGGKHADSNSLHYYVCRGDAPSSIGTDGKLATNERLESPNKHYTLLMQEDGNLVLYAGSQGAIWASQSSSRSPGSCVLVNQADGNLVVYGAEGAIWSTGQGGRPKAATTLVLQDDGNLVKYRADGAATWTSDTSRQDLRGQANWRWCNKCGLMHFPDGPSVCPAGGAHSSSHSSNYAISHR